jgi:hypothetical protein
VEDIFERLTNNEMVAASPDDKEKVLKSAKDGGKL